MDDRYGVHTRGQGVILFAEEVMGAVLDPWQREFLQAFGDGARGITVAACQSGEDITFVGLAPGVVHPIRCTHVLDAGTATDIVGLT
jgi:hypothetical protein